jgi:hypothetical protein
MKVYVVMICDRHCDPEPYVFETPEDAIAYARSEAVEGARVPENIVEEHIPAWLYYARYSPEGDSVWVIEKDVRREGWTG